VKTQNVEKCLAVDVVICEFWRLAMAIACSSESCVSSQQIHSPIQTPSVVTPTSDNTVA
jgi:hypothetical protein